MEQLAERHREDEIPCDALWLDIDYMDGYRVFTWNTDAFPDVAGMLARLTDMGFRVITIIDPGVKYEPGYWVFDQARGARRAVQDRGRRHLHRAGVAGQHRVPGLRHRGSAHLVGRTERGACAQSGLAGIWNDMNEPATGDDPARRRCVSATGSTRTSATTTSTPC